jgi:protease I
MIPGGFINPDLLRQSAEAREFVRRFDASGKPIATLCHGPWLLASAGLTRGRRMTSWPGVRDDLVNAGATWLDETVVMDGNWLTSRGPQDMAPFVRALVPFFGGQVDAAQAADSATAISSPQRDAPPQLVLDAMRWLPRPSFRALALVGALAALYMARNNRKGLRTLAG